MLAHDQTKTLFQLSTELTEGKVEVSVIKANAELIKIINEFRLEMRQEMSKLECRLAAVEATLNMRNQINSELRNRFFDYIFKAGWVVALGLTSVIIYHRAIFF